MQTKIPIETPHQVQCFWNALYANGYDTYLVGGAVRDILLGIEPHDYDLATSATPEEITKTLKEYFPDIKIDYVGASFGVIIADGIEIATFRGERYVGDGNQKHVNVEYVQTIEEDLSRRDLTINAMAISWSRKIIDPFNGQEDLEAGLINFVGSAIDRINEDANRILRAIRFASKYNFEYDVYAKVMLWDAVDHIHKIAPERIRLELIKAMDMDKPSNFFGDLEFFGILKHLFPELRACIDHDGGKHHAETVWEHSMLVGDNISKKNPIVRLAGYLHDIGKPDAFQECMKEERTAGKFIGHERIGKSILKIRLKDLTFSSKEIECICGLTRNHMAMLINMSAKNRRKLLKVLDGYDVDWRDLIRLRIADAKGNLAQENLSFGQIRNMFMGFINEPDVPFNVHSLSVKGAELIHELELEPGPVVSDLQRHLLQYAIDTGIQDPDCLLLEAARYSLKDEKKCLR